MTFRLSAPQSGRPLEQLRPAERDHEQPMARATTRAGTRRSRASEASAQCMSSNTIDRRRLVREPLEEQAATPAKRSWRSRVGPVARARADSRAAARRTGAPRGRARCVARPRGAASARRPAAPSPSAMPAARPHHLGERPVRHALAVRETPSSMPVGVSPRARRCTCRTPRPSRDFPIPGPRRSRTAAAPAPRRVTWKISLILRSSRSRPTNGASRPCGALPSPHARRRRATRATATLAPPSP